MPESELSFANTSHGNDETSSKVSGTNTANELPDDSCIQGAMRACSQDEAGVHISFPHAPPLGNCQYGHQVCNLGVWGACVGLVAPLPRDNCNIDGDDANCNGAANEGCECIDAQSSRACGVSALGVCKLGLQACEGGTWGSCEGAVNPTSEKCDQKGIDEDCDGDIDLADADCACIEGEQELCTRPEQGDCHLGIKTCVKGQWSACQPRFPRLDLESCAPPRMDAHGSAPGDEDCDGQVNNTPTTGKDPVDCKIYMVDEDKDGYGAIGLNYNLGQDGFTYGCFCQGHVPLPSMVLAPEGQHNKDCGDCPLDGAPVHPGVKDPQTRPSTCLERIKWKGGSFDFNCTGSIDLERASLAKCVEQEGQCVTQTGDWNHMVPACGESGRIGSECISTEPPCELLPSMVVEIQRCL